MSLGKKKERVGGPLFGYTGIAQERDFFIENMSMLLASGMDVMSAMKALEEEMRFKRMKKVLHTLIEAIDEGIPLWSAFGKARLFPPQYIALIKLGEESGQLARNLRMIVVQQQKDRLLKSRLRSALLYPVMVLVLACGIGLGIVWFILPKLAFVFGSLHVQLPWMTKVLIKSGMLLKEYGGITVPVFVVAISGIVYMLFVDSKTRFLGEHILWEIPVIRRLMRTVEIARFGSLLSELLESGVGLDMALRSLSDATPFRWYKKLYHYLADCIEEGKTFKVAFASYKQNHILIPIAVQHMIVAGEQSGKIIEGMKNVGDIFEQKAIASTKDMMTLLEPMMLIIVWLGVLFIALAVIMPIYTLVGGLY